MKIPRQPLPITGEGFTHRLYLDADQRRAWNWVATRSSVGLNDFIRHACDGLLRQFVRDFIANGGNPPQNVAEYLSR